MQNNNSYPLFIIFYSLTALICSCTNMAKKVPDYERLNLNGNVKSIAETYFLPSVSGDTIKCGERTTYPASFFEPQENEPFYPYKTMVYFNQNGYITECFMDDSATNFHFKEIFQYQDNRLVQKLGSLSDTFFYKEIYKYDSKNRETEKKFYDSETHLFETVITEYPKRNTVFEKVRTGNEYSDFDRETKFKSGLPVSSINRIVADGIIDKWSGEYDDDGHLILSKFFDSQGSVLYYVKYFYDEYGNESGYSNYSDNDEFMSKYDYRYKYDKYGNWIQKVSIADGYPEIIMEREIVYY